MQQTSTVSEIRQRKTGAPTNDANFNMGESNSLFSETGSGLSASVLLNSSPPHHGPVMKLHVPRLYTILPEFVQRFLSSIAFLSFLCPSWKERYLVLCGSFLYKFSSATSKEPKGSLFDVQTVEVGYASMNYVHATSQLGPHYKALITVSTLRRQHVYAVASKEDAEMWVRSIEESRHECITRNMGHASNFPYPTRWKHLDALGRSFVKRKDRIRGRLESSQLREMEMSSFADGGPLPRGYHG